MEIVIDLKKVLEDVGRESAYVGAKNINEKDTARYGRIATTSADREQLNGAIKTAVGELANASSDHLTRAVFVDEESNAVPAERAAAVVLTYSMTHNFDRSAELACQESAHRYIVEMALAEWMAVVEPDRVQYYGQQAQVAFKQFLIAFFKRERPGMQRVSIIKERGL